MTKMAQLISKMEGFGKPGIATLRNNPGNLRHSPHSSHEGIGPNDIGIIDTVEHGWEDLEHQLQRFANEWLTISQAIYKWAPPSDNNNTENYIQFICDGLEMNRDDHLFMALKKEA